MGKKSKFVSLETRTTRTFAPAPRATIASSMSDIMAHQESVVRAHEARTLSAPVRAQPLQSIMSEENTRARLKELMEHHAMLRSKKLAEETKLAEARARTAALRQAAADTAQQATVTAVSGQRQPERRPTRPTRPKPASRKVEVADFLPSGVKTCAAAFRQYDADTWTTPLSTHR